MHKGKYVFSQLLNLIDKDVFLRITNRYGGNRYDKIFTCWNRLGVLMFGQLSNREKFLGCYPGDSSSLDEGISSRLREGGHEEQTVEGQCRSGLPHLKGILVYSH